MPFEFLILFLMYIRNIVSDIYVSLYVINQMFASVFKSSTASDFNIELNEGSPGD